MKETSGGKTPLRWLKAANRLIVAFQRLGLVVDPMRLLSVPGRRSGKLRATPVSPLVVDGERYVVALFEGADWVENARAGGWGILARGRKKERVTLVELPPEERGSVLREFPGERPQGARFMRQRYGIPNDPEAFAALASRCPVFHIGAVPRSRRPDPRRSTPPVGVSMTSVNPARWYMAAISSSVWTLRVLPVDG